MHGTSGQSAAAIAAAARPAPDTRPGPARVSGTLAVTLGVAAACWYIAIRRMSGMGMGTSTSLGSFGSFAVLWLVMMAAVTAFIGGIVVLGTNTSTAKQMAADMARAETQRSGLIDRLDLRVVTGASTESLS